MLRIIFAILLVASILCYIGIGILDIVRTENHNSKDAAMQIQVDSLNSELNILKIENGRYEFIIDEIRKIDSTKIDLIINQTE